MNIKSKLLLSKKIFFYLFFILTFGTVFWCFYFFAIKKINVLDYQPLADSPKRQKAVKSFLTFNKNGKNILYLMSDEITGLNFESLIKENKSENKLTDFTFYEKTFTAGLVTNSNYSTMLGSWNHAINYKNNPKSPYYNQNFMEFYKGAYSQLIETLNEGGYNEGAFLSTLFMSNSDERANSFEGDSTLWNQEINQKYPNFYSGYAHDIYESNAGSSKGMGYDELGVRSLEAISKSIKVDNQSKQNIFKMYTNETTHLNYRYRENGKIKTGDIIKANNFFLFKLIAIIDKLKSLGIYDNTMIIVASDHGNATIGEVKSSLEKLQNNLQAKAIIKNKTQRQNNLLMFKSFKNSSLNHNKKLKWDNKHAISTADIPQIIAHEIGSGYITKIFNNNVKIKNLNHNFDENPLGTVKRHTLSTQYGSWHINPKQHYYLQPDGFSDWKGEDIKTKNLVFNVDISANIDNLYNYAFWKADEYK